MADQETKSGPAGPSLQPPPQDGTIPPQAQVVAMGVQQKPLAFNKSDPQLWLAQIENVFAMNRITAEITKYQQAVSALGFEATIVRDLIVNVPPVNPYTTLKNAIISRTSVSEEKRFQDLVIDEALGDRKPSSFLRILQQKAADLNVNDGILRSIFLQKLPDNMKTILAASKGSTLDELAEIADRVFEIAAPSVSAIQPTAVATGSTSNLEAQVRELASMVKQLMSQPKQRGRSESRSNNGRGRGRKFNLNMEPELTFGFLNLVLVTYGAAIFMKSRAMHVINWVFMSFFAVFAIISVITIEISSTHEHALHLIRRLAINLSPLISQVLLICKRNQIKQLTIQLFSCLTEFYKRKIRNITVLVASVYFAILGLHAGFLIGFTEYHPVDMSIFNATIKASDMKWYHNVLDGFQYAHIPLKKQWFLVSVMIYIVNLFQWSMAETVFNTELARKQDVKHISAIIKSKHRLNNVKRHFNEVLSPFPLIWLTSLFLQSSGLLLYLTEPDKNDFYRLFVYAVEAIWVVAVLSLVILMENRSKESTRKMLEELDLFNRPVGDSNGLQDWIRLRECMTENVEFHAMLFNLDRSLILGFIGSLITFSVMFVQLNH
ncbi:hypothetical protein HDE_05521 [Halotydeus destructor]|nr:hypothetical protein HDE_05521 [Halotydeus destructor]